jgi:hypothetical protein
MLYGHWLILGGKIKEARSMLETAKTTSGRTGIDSFLKQPGDLSRDIQFIDEYLQAISRIVPLTGTALR